MISKDRRWNKESVEATSVSGRRLRTVARTSRGGESAQPLVGAAGQRGDSSGELELEERDRDRVGREAGTLAERIDAGRIVSEGRQHAPGCTLDRSIGCGCGGRCLEGRNRQE